MRRFLRTLSIIISFTILGACAPNSRDAGSQATTTYEPPKPVIVKEDGYRVARGATDIQDMNVVFDPATKSMNLRGKLEYLSTMTHSRERVDINLSGILDAQGFINLKNPNDKSNGKEGVRVAAKATCLNERPDDCSSSFIDIYVYVDGIVYHHQVESHQDAKEQPQQPKEDKKDGKKGSLEDPKQDNTEHDDLESEGGSDEVDETPGRYVGDLKSDVEVLLDVKPEATVKDEPNKEEPKKEDPKKEDPKTPPVKNPPATPPVSGKEPPKKEEPKKEEPKKEDPKKVPTPVPRPSPEPSPAPGKTPTPQPEEPAKTPVIEKISQAIGPVNRGRLQNAVNMLNYENEKAPTGFHIIRPARLTHFATNEMAYILAQAGQLTKKMIPDYVLSVGDISRETGGKLGSHKSHQNGLDADVAYYFNNKSFQGYFASAVAVDKPHANFMVEQQWKLFKAMNNTQLVDRIFIHPVLKKALCELAIKNGELQKGHAEGEAYNALRRLISESAHNNHFHLRVKCSSAQIRCQQMAEPANTSGCF